MLLRGYPGWRIEDFEMLTFGQVKLLMMHLVEELGEGDAGEDGPGRTRTGRTFGTLAEAAAYYEGAGNREQG